jgi:curved DNA-binding protein CbpA
MTDAELPDHDGSGTDPYEVLQLNPKAHPLVVMRTFRLLAAMYHPDNKQTGDRAKFERVINAYRILSDPARRGRFDRAEAPTGAVTDEQFVAPQEQKQAYPDERRLRLLVLRTLYNTRRTSLSKPGLSLRVLADMTDAGLDDIQFSLWYLRGKKFIEIGEDDEMAITVTGVDYIEETASATEELLSLPEALHALDEGEGPAGGAS